MDGSWTTGDGPDHWAGNTWAGMADDFLVLTPFENMPADVAKAAQKAADDIKSGTNKILLAQFVIILAPKKCQLAKP